MLQQVYLNNQTPQTNKPHSTKFKFSIIHLYLHNKLHLTSHIMREKLIQKDLSLLKQDTFFFIQFSEQNLNLQSTNMSCSVSTLSKVRQMKTYEEKHTNNIIKIIT